MKTTEDCYRSLDTKDAEKATFKIATGRSKKDLTETVTYKRQEYESLRDEKEKER